MRWKNLPLRSRRTDGATNVIRAVVFDVGETLIDDTAEWARWAEWIGVPLHTFSAVMGAVTVSGHDNAETFQYFRPGFDLAIERQRREEAGLGENITDLDLYPDVRSSLSSLREMGLWLGVAGNQTARAAELLRGLDLQVDAVATSGEWGVAKPRPEFFERIIDLARLPAAEIAYVGDHRDNDIVPARAAGLLPILIRRGPWGYLWADDREVRQQAHAVIDSLAELPQVIGSFT